MPVERRVAVVGTEASCPFKNGGLARTNNTIGCASRGGGLGGGARRAAESRPASYGKSEVARWPRLRGTVVSGPKMTGNWKSFWKVRARNGKTPKRADVRILSGG